MSITLGQYIFERMNQLHVKTIFGVPGDFNLLLLDYISKVPGMRWAGNANELNAAYAADGYSRVTRLGCIVTTFGVGELSALNGIAGAYAEQVGLVHIAGVPATSSQNNRLLLHHTLGNGDFTVYRKIKMSAHLLNVNVMLKDITTAPSEIDRCIREAYIHQRPVYIGLPTNLVDIEVPRSLLDTEIDLTLPETNAAAEEEVVSRVLDLIKGADNPIIIVDACCARHGCRGEAQKLIELTQFPTFTTPMGKGAVNESHPRFGGVYLGDLSSPDVKEFVNNKADLIISLGAVLSDFNTGAFTHRFSTNDLIEVHSDYTKIRNATYERIQMKHVLNTLLGKIGSAIKDYKPVELHFPSLKQKIPSASGTGKVSQEYLWKAVAKFFREDDIVITETGTSSFGIVQSKFPNETLGISQVLWGSIGYTVGATLGALMAAEESKKPSRRVILFIGDGSLQLTVQEISTMCKWNLKPYLFVLNNNGYTIERLIHGEKASYNDVQPWKHLKLLDLFNAQDYENITVNTDKELDELFTDQKFAKNDKIRMIELHLEEMDAPISLIEQANKTSQTNAS
ncbi:hypothetical protein BABINDRAFT_66342 [Babjeviella inositovora NRRL Y-12698]|uniref:Pyruvate decarboxylase n=1 Tax=Babjeviella inositovora NRRL Y-12698 TaxID=984486 RepID=A0A1E3QJX6_9ASCO|nr:uncharacterized protein BABINDRAFT_66342 [Babjeviella inositovora NRRL Y-12698]ODQ77774.1 hypothetical protein BABINDRAFT_66342 [Babjeviella inositovora NRRL Y-12698]